MATTANQRKSNPKPPNQTKANQIVNSSEFENHVITFTPFAERDKLELSVKAVKNILAVRSKSGREPGNGDIWKFMVLCRSRRLNPFVQDCYLIGYDSKVNEQWVTKWSLIIAVQALRKRGEGHPQFDGCQCGVIVKSGEEIIEREGTMTYDKEAVLGGWAIVYRKDRRIPEKRTVKFSVYNTGKSRWEKDPSGMIVKCAEAAAYRAAFPSDLAGLYVAEEFDKVIDVEHTPVREVRDQSKNLAAVTEKLLANQADGIEPPPADENDGVDPPHSEDEANQGESPDDGSQLSDAERAALEAADRESEKRTDGKQRELIEKGSQSYE